MALLTDKVLDIEDVQYDTVPVPEWSGEMRVRSATAIERNDYEQGLWHTDENGKLVSNARNAKARLVVKCVVDEEGKRVFTDAQAEALGRKNSAAVERLFRRIQKLSGMDAGAFKELEKNSDAGKAGNSPSDSPAT